MNKQVAFYLVVIMSQCIHFNCRTDASPTQHQLAKRKIQIALLLDTSNSMDGLIEQAKSRLWEIVNTLSSLKSREQAPILEISLYEYGNDKLSERVNYIHQVLSFTSDLDRISDELFQLRTNGGNEYCGAVIQKSIQQLEWTNSDEDFKLIYIAGNEPFNQGPISYEEACSLAKSKGIIVNTIFCGNYEEGISSFWKSGAVRTNGKYFNINSDEQIVYIETPYDIHIENLNIRLNKTYIGYGANYQGYISNQAEQDKNASKISKSNMAERAISKSKKIYNNSSWDLVDKSKEDKTIISTMSDEELPQELRGLTKIEKEKYIERKTKEREQIQKEISDLALKRDEYIRNQKSKQGSKADDFGSAIKKSIMELALIKGYSI